MNKKIWESNKFFYVSLIFLVLFSILFFCYLLWNLLRNELHNKEYSIYHWIVIAIIGYLAQGYSILISLIRFKTKSGDWSIEYASRQSIKVAILYWIFIVLYFPISYLILQMINFNWKQVKKYPHNY